MSVNRLAIIGSGTMGSGIAINAVQHGLTVTLIDTQEGAVARARSRAESVLARFVEKGRMTAEGAADAMARLLPGDALEAAHGADLVIEAIFEDFRVKADLFEKLTPIIGRQALIATNTSALRVSDLARHVEEPGRFLGLHYFSPAEVNPVCEVVKGARTGDGTIAAATAFLKATKRIAIPCRDNYGFAINRFFCPYTNEAARLVDDGFSTAEVDRASVEALGAAAGPFFVQNIIKPRINLNAIRNLSPLGPFYAPAETMIRVGESGENFVIDPASDPQDSARDAVMVARLRGAVFLAILEELDEAIAEPAAIDEGASLALKFAKAPCALMDALGREAVEALVVPLAEKYGVGVPASLARVGQLRA